MLQKKYHIDREFNIILLLDSEMDEQMTLIDHLLCDEKLLELKLRLLAAFYLKQSQFKQNLCEAVRE
ncbi:hypothetical protein [Nostoc sp. TCL240-02]|uniref:hypothetical protein n=1 Tax=Nostoc sp. TCL240-02 TaxID=2572090 RepID=UPI00157F9778|nr:hypothetical protein [Nostoc sp. TCL240-02]QKQ73142.1 hypothetical protein FBB35_06900 [Nostoc sp. TCL240-02]